MAIALADHLGFKVLGRASQRSGPDWVLVRKGEPTNDYYRLEVSGMARVNMENPSRPGVAVVARFEDMRILSETCP